MNTLNRFSILVILWCVLGAVNSAYGRTEKYFDFFEVPLTSEFLTNRGKKELRSPARDLPMFRNYSQLSSRNSHLSLVSGNFGSKKTQFQVLQKTVNCSLLPKPGSLIEDLTLKQESEFKVRKGIVFINKSQRKINIKNSFTPTGFQSGGLFHHLPTQLDFERSIPINFKSEGTGFGENIKWLSFRNYAIQ